MERWSALDRRERFRIALEVARRRGREFCAAIGNVVSVGAGLRSRGESNTILDEVCLRFLVKRKWGGCRARPQKIPEYITAYPDIQGKRVRVRIPTDVSEFKDGIPHSSLDLTAGITSRQNNIDLEYGSACCLVRNTNQPAERYLLSCYHVFSPQLIEPLSGRNDCVESATDRIIGEVVSTADAYGGSRLDAALVLIDDPNVDVVSVWGKMPVAKATDFDVAMMYERGQMFLMCRSIAPAANGLSEALRTKPLVATFQSFFPNPIPFDYRSTVGRFLYFADTIQYIADVRSGDSGSALVDGAGMLYGMHFYGQGNVGFAMSAPRLFDPNVFSVDISL